jgi:hypothetical protein
MSQSSTSVSQAAQILSKAVPSADKKSALQKKQEMFASSKTSIFEKVIANDEISKQFGALTPTMIKEAIHDSGELAVLPAPKGVTRPWVAEPYSTSYGYNATKSEYALVAKPELGREFVNGTIGQPGENKGKLSDMKSCFDLDWVNGLTSLTKHKVIRAMSKAFGSDNTGFVYNKATGVYTSKMLFGAAARAFANRQRQAVKRDDGIKKKHAEKQRRAAARAAKPPRTKQTKEEKNAKARKRRAEKKAAEAAGGPKLTPAQLAVKYAALEKENAALRQAAAAAAAAQQPPTIN